MNNSSQRFVRCLAIVLCGIVAPVPGCDDDRAGSGEGNVIRIASKDFGEQFILAELMAQLIEGHTDLKVERVLNLGGTMVCHNALVNGDIDLYAEYTGTALMTILKRENIHDAERINTIVQSAYEEKFDCRWLQPFGFDNTYTLALRSGDAERKGWKTFSDLKDAAPALRAGFTHEFIGRTDGLPGLKKEYGLEFKSVQALAPTLMYQALKDGQVDVICAFATDGRIQAYKLATLADDRGFFPPYAAAPVVRSTLLKARPQLEKVLNLLAGKIDDQTMRRLNYQVDEHQKDPADVASEFLKELGLADPS